MAGWDKHRGLAVALNRNNIDTDQLIPARFMSQPRAAGYGAFLLHDLRRSPDGTLLPDFPLNRTDRASILVTGQNFGSGSSREAAVYALVDAGFRAVISPSFGDIFDANAVNNGLLPARISADDAQALNKALSETGTEVTVDLTDLRITVGNTDYGFDLPDAWRAKLINGWDDIDLTQQHTAAITAFWTERHQSTPWAKPTGCS